MTTPHTDSSTPASTPSSLFWQRFRELGSLRRPADHRAVGGVAEGLSRHFDVDPIIVRVLFVALTFFGGAGIILYLALWVTVPREDQPHSMVSGRMHRDPTAVITAGLAVGGIGAGVAFLGSLSWAVPHPFPTLLVVVLIGILALALTRRRDEGWRYPAPPPSGPTAASEPASGTDAGTDAGAAQTAPVYLPAVAPTAYPVTMTQETAVLGGATPAPPAFGSPEPTTAAYPTAPSSTAWWQRQPVPPGGSPMPPVPDSPPPPKKPKSHLFGFTMAAVAIAIAGVWIADASTSLDPDPSVYPGVALAIIAVALLVSAWWGRSRGLIAWGIVAGLLTAGAAFLGPGPYGDIVRDPTAANQLESSYRLGAGQFTLRLEDVADVQNLNGKATRIDARFGRVLIIVPSSVAAFIDATVDHGEIDGAPIVQDLDNDGEHAFLNPSTAGRPAMTITVYLRFGQIQIERATCPGDGAPLAGESTTPWKGDIDVASACN